MGSDFYSEDYGGDYYDYYGGGGSGDYGGGLSPDTPIDWGFDTTSWPTLDQGGGTTSDSINWESFGYSDLGDGYIYDPSTGNVLDTGLQQGGTDLVGAFFDYYSSQGYDDQTALQLAVQDATPSIVQETTSTQALPPDLPDITGPYFPLPYVEQNYWQSPPYVPNFPEGPAPSPPLGPSPASSQPNLPPACPGGQYHPYPIGHPQQNICVPFPAATTNAPKPPSQQAPAPAPKPPSQQQQQQACPQGYYRDVATGQCKPIPRCTTPGTVYDQRSGRCVPSGQASAPGCPPGEWFNPQTQRCEIVPACATPGTVFDVTRGMCVPPDQLTSGEDIFGGLKNIPWWLWAAAGALLLLGQNDEGGRKTTVYHRRAS